MLEHATLVHAPSRPRDSSRGSLASLPADLLEQIRGRVRILALLMIAAFGFGLVMFAGVGLVTLVLGNPLSPDYIRLIPFQWVSVVATVASALLWWAARERGIPAARLHALSLVYVVLICFLTAIETYWGWWSFRGSLPNMTWVPAIVIFFPTLIPGPPRRMLAAALAAGATAPLTLLLLDRFGLLRADSDAYSTAIMQSLTAVGCAYWGARVIYGLGKEVAAARDLGSYQLEERLGQGGMGEVWRAKHRLLARPAAIKLIRQSTIEQVHPDVLAAAERRFEREAQVIARLRSPHTVELFDFGIAEGGSFYYVMELLVGCDADTLVRRFGPIPSERVIYLLRQVCHSLSEAESCGLVHRDIKPANIFLCRYGEEFDFVKVLDFGLVKALDVSAPSGSTATRDNAVQGTPAFMAPEQALGRTDIDSRADVYATGCVAYWLLTGKLVFTADTPIALLMHQATTPPVPPSARTELPIPLAMEELVLACLSKDPAARPQSARELSRRLGEIEGASAWTEERAREWWDKHQPTAAN